MEGQRAGYFNPFRQFNGIFIPDWMLRVDLTWNARATYALLAKRAGQNGDCFPGMATIAADLNISERSAKRAVKELKDQELIEAHRGKGRAGMTNRYVFVFWTSMVDSMQNPPEDTRNVLPSGDSPGTSACASNGLSHYKEKASKEKAYKVSKQKQKQKCLFSIYEKDCTRNETYPHMHTYEGSAKLAGELWEDMALYYERDRWEYIGLVYEKGRHLLSPTETDLQLIIDTFLHRYFRKSAREGASYEFLKRRYSVHEQANFLLCDSMAAGFTLNTGKYLDFYRKGKIGFPEKAMAELYNRLQSRGGSYTVMFDRMSDLMDESEYYTGQETLALSAFISMGLEYIDGL